MDSEHAMNPAAKDRKYDEFREMRKKECKQKNIMLGECDYFISLLLEKKRKIREAVMEFILERSRRV